MAYTWEEESDRKYGKEVTAGLVKTQLEYEEKHKGNNCKHCGKANEGEVIESAKGVPFMMHYGMWTGSKCDYCGNRR